MKDGIAQGQISEREIVIKACPGLARFDFMELWDCRHMLWNMVQRDLKVQFQDMYFGYFWAVSRPLAMLLVFTYIKHFSGARLHENLPYAFYFYSGVILWIFFLEALKGAQKGIEKDAALIKKIYYPRLISPIARIMSATRSFFIAFIPLIIMMVLWKISPNWKIIFLPVVIALTMLLALGVGVIFSSLCLLNKDYDKFLGLCLYLIFFATPVFYSPEMIPTKLHLVYNLNPMVGILLGFRASLFYNYAFPYQQFAYSCLATALILPLGITMFGRMEAYFADRL